MDCCEITLLRSEMCPACMAGDIEDDSLPNLESAFELFEEAGYPGVPHDEDSLFRNPGKVSALEKGVAWKQICDEAIADCCKPEWAYVRFKNLFGHWPPPTFLFPRSVHNRRYFDKFSVEYTEQEKRKFFVDLLVFANEKGFKQGWAYHRYRERFGEFPSQEFQKAG